MKANFNFARFVAFQKEQKFVAIKARASGKIPIFQKNPHSGRFSDFAMLKKMAKYNKAYKKL